MVSAEDVRLGPGRCLCLPACCVPVCLYSFLSYLLAATFSFFSVFCKRALSISLADAQQAVRHQAAAVVAALALSSPPLLARLFGECLEGVETFCQQLMLLAAPYTKPRASLGASAAASASGSGNSWTPGQLLGRIRCKNVVGAYWPV